MANLLKEGRIILVSSQTNNRAGLRKTLCDLGASNKLIEVAGDFDQAKEILSHGPVNIIITDDDIGKSHTGLDLLPLFSANNPISRSRVFVLLTAQSTPFVMADFISKGGDCIINKPINNEVLIKTLTNIIKEKDNMPFEEGLIYDIRDALEAKNIQQAEEIYSSFQDFNIPQAHYAKAIIHYANHEMESAFDYFLKGLDKKANFMSLIYVIKLGVSLKRHFDLLQYVVMWLKSFPIHHDSLPDITRVIIANKKFDLLDELFLLLAQHKTEDLFAKIPLAAGFVLASAYNLENGEEERAKRYALKGLEYGGNKFQIFYRAIELLVKAQAFKAAEDAYNNKTVEIVTVEEKIQDLMLKEMIYPIEKVLSHCKELLAANISHPDLYQITINCMKKMGKDPDEICMKAQRIFPDFEFTK